MNDAKSKAGYFTFYGPNGELRRFQTSEPLAYALLGLLERGLAWPDGGSRELDRRAYLAALASAEGDGSEPKRCADCGGAGVVYVDELEIADFQRVTCRACDGTGLA